MLCSPIFLTVPEARRILTYCFHCFFRFLQEKTKKILDIWTKGNTFPSDVLSRLTALTAQAKAAEKGAYHILYFIAKYILLPRQFHCRLARVSRAIENETEMRICYARNIPTTSRDQHKRPAHTTCAYSQPNHTASPNRHADHGAGDSGSRPSSAGGAPGAPHNRGRCKSWDEQVSNLIVNFSHSSAD